MPSYIPKSYSSLKSPIQLELDGSKLSNCAFKLSSEIELSNEVHIILVSLKVWSN